MINDELLWEQFVMSGSIDAYLSYRQITDRQPAHGRETGSTKQRNEHI